MDSKTVLFVDIPGDALTPRNNGVNGQQVTLHSFNHSTYLDEKTNVWIDYHVALVHCGDLFYSIKADWLRVKAVVEVSGSPPNPEVGPQ